MQQPIDDEMLVAYLDGELPDEQHADFQLLKSIKLEISRSAHG